MSAAYFVLLVEYWSLDLDRWPAIAGRLARLLDVVAKRHVEHARHFVDRNRPAPVQIPLDAIILEERLRGLSLVLGRDGGEGRQNRAVRDLELPRGDRIEPCRVQLSQPDAIANRRARDPEPLREFGLAQAVLVVQE